MLALVVFALVWVPTAVLRDTLAAMSLDPPARISLGLANMLVPVLLLAFVTPLVSYRRRDALCALIPFYNIWFTARIAWRLAYLPYHDWLPRDDERADWQLVRHPADPARLAHVVIRRDV
ncbi:hypothetical protein GCM10009682_08000 [Luedemannella flava]|uniref:Uncharacterized protein n=1 Tax=Luedemannella flava TaxID=349316 RepID=A0ABN2LH75_9ACTN